MGWLSLQFQIILCLPFLLFVFPSLCFSVSSKSHSLCPPDQSTSLLQFKTSFIVINTTSLYCNEAPSLKMETWENGTDCCSWLGVTCDAVSGNVIGLNLTCHGIQGTIHPNTSLFLLSHLQTLNLSWNDIQGQIPSQFGGFKSLEYLDLSYTSIQGQIPSQISHLSKLLLLDLSITDGLKWNEYTLKRLLQNATSLRDLVLDENDMSSINPNSMSLLFNGSASLVSLSLDYTRLSGNFTDAFLCPPNLQKLDLSSNRGLQGQLPRLSCSASLSVLDLSGCQFQGPIPPSFSNLTRLTSMDLSTNYNLNGSIPSSLLTLPRLTSLYLSSNDLSGRIPDVSHQSNALYELDLSYNNLEGELPPSLSNLQQLMHLDLSHNRLNGFMPSSLSQLPQLTYLYLSNNQLSDLSPSSLSQLPQLTYLYLSNNQLSDLSPSSLSQLPQLTYLDLSNNRLSDLSPSSLSQLPQLTDLYLYNNRLSHFSPSSLSQLPQLTYLDLSNNQLSDLSPSSLSQLPQLTYLDLSNNRLRDLSPSSISQLPHLTHLDLSSNKLEGPLPNQITGLLPNLTELHLNNNFLNGTIPSWCLSFPSLTYLDLSNNQFSGHLSAISSYSLYELNLCGNKLQGNIPESIFNLGNLIDLCLSSNNWSGPVDFQIFSKLQNLKYLSLSQNSQLSLNFESSVNYSFPWLTTLKLSYVGLTRFPNLSGKFPSLTYLDLSNNKLNGRVPDDWLLELDSLIYLNMSQNLLTSIDRLPRHHELTNLDCSFNLLSGDISLLVCNATTWFEYLNLSHNNLTGTIPPCLAKLSALKVLDLQMNKLHGTLPNICSKINQLETLNLNGNQLQDLLRHSLSNCRELQVLNLGSNQIEGTFPFWLQTLPYLKVLVLRSNKLHGTIANLKSKQMFPSLIIFDISCNNFSGPIPKAYVQNFEAMKNVIQGGLPYIGKYSNKYRPSEFSFYDDYVNVTIKGNSFTLVKIPAIFVNIDLSRNNFEGEIPEVIGELHLLKGLNLSHNRLIGAIPRSIGNLSNLEWLDLSSNMLSGVIPTELTKLNSLEVLDLSYNRLVGEIPQGKQFNTFSNDSYKGNLGLCGFPMSIQCNPGQHSPPPSQTMWSEEKFGFGWKPVAIGYGCGMVFGIGLGCLVLLIGKPRWLVSMVGGKASSKRVRRRTRMTTRTRGMMNQ